MLKGISPLIQPELLKILAEMGHGDELVIGDANFPAASMGKRCVRCDGHKVTDILDAILKLFPLDTFVEKPIILMQVVPGTLAQDPPIWKEIKSIVDKHEPGSAMDWIERYPFYQRSQQAFATIQTGETSLYACVIIKKGVIS